MIGENSAAIVPRLHGRKRPAGDDQTRRECRADTARTVLRERHHDHDLRIRVQELQHFRAIRGLENLRLTVIENELHHFAPANSLKRSSVSLAARSSASSSIDSFCALGQCRSKTARNWLRVLTCASSMSIALRNSGGITETSSFHIKGLLPNPESRHAANAFVISAFSDGTGWP